MEKRSKTKKLNTTPKIIVITGAESTGKSTLTGLLASHFNVPFVPEIAREYVEKINRKYNYEDVTNIAKKQVEQLNKKKDSNFPFIFVDTWLIVTKIWFDVVFKKTPDWLIEEIEKTKIDLFLVCDIDLPWIFDPIRENGGEKRKYLQQEYIRNIEKFSFRYKIVSGKNNERLNNALQFLNEIK